MEGSIRADGGRLRVTRRRLLQGGVGAVGLYALGSLELAEDVALLPRTESAEAGVTGEFVRRFHGLDWIRCDIGGCNLTGALTIAVAFRLDAIDHGHTLVSNRTSAGAIAHAVFIDGTESLALDVGGTSFSLAQADVVAGRWHVAVARKRAGLDNGRLSLYDPVLDTWTHSDVNDLPNAASQAGGAIDFGAWDGDDNLIGDIAAAAQWSGFLTDVQVETLSAFLADFDDLSAWSALAPAGLWRFDQDDSANPVADLTSNGADQTAIAGTAAFAVGTFQSSFEGGTFNEWTTWERSDEGTMYVDTAQSEGIPALAGLYVARFEVDATDSANGDVHSKVYKSWGIAPPSSGWTDDAHRVYEPLGVGGPDGIYSAWFRFPSTYVPSSSWANVFQWKEGYLTDPEDEESWEQDPQWWLNVAPAGSWSSTLWPQGVSSSDDPVLVTNNWDAAQESPRNLRALPLGAWFEIRAELHSGDRIDWYVDQTFWQSSPHARYPVGLSKATPVEWVFGVGHYGGLGHLWVDEVRYEPF